MNFLGKNPADENVKWPENLIQCYIIQEARRLDWKVAGSMEQGARGNGAKAKASGLTAGECDLRFYLSMGRVVFIELKRMDGRVSDVQERYHAMLMGLGHMVHVVWAKSPVDGWEQTRTIIEGYMKHGTLES